jgi:hypothetical protein
MSVQVSDICDRCGRATPVHMSNDELVAETEKRKNIEAVVKEFDQYICSKDPNTLPTILVVYRSPKGEVSIKSQISICNPKEESKRSCAKRVAELVADLFPIPADERAPRKPKAAKPAATNGDKKKDKK